MTNLGISYPKKYTNKSSSIDCRSARKMRTKKALKNPLALMLCCLLASSAFALEEDRCGPDAYAAVNKSMKITPLSPANVISADCRTWPYKPHLLLAVFAYDEGIESEKKLLVAVIDEKTNRVVSSFQDAYYEDALTEVGEYSLKLDTARYQLAENVRAFGIRFNSAAHGANCGEAYWGNELTLFVPEGKKLRPVASLNLYQQQWHRGCPAATSSALWEDATLTVGMGQSGANGFQDLEITAKIGVNSMESPTGKLKNRIERHTLHYDGKFYKKDRSVVPWWLAI